MKPQLTDFTIYPSKFGTYGKEEGDEQRWAIGLAKWEEWLGAKVVTKVHGLTALCYCLWEMTYHGFSQQKVQGTLRMIKNRVKDIDQNV